MVRVYEIYNYLNSLYPFDKQESWDNSGLLVGNANNLVNKIALCLDITSDAVSKAEDMEADLIISHHPVIFKPLKALLGSSVPFQLAGADISAICIHTPLDNAVMGVNDALAKKLRLENVRALKLPDKEQTPLRIGETELTSCEKLASFIKAALGSADVRFNDTGREIKTVGVCGGSGNDFIDNMLAAGVDAFVTGDAGHHDFLHAQHNGIALFAAGHYETEVWVLKILENKLLKAFDNIEVGIIEQSSPVKSV